MAAFELLDEKMCQWVWRQGWRELRPIQENAIGPILEGNSDVIISAATAGGKTEAAFLPIFTRLLSQEQRDGFQAIVVSPLKALINDQARRLEDMAQGTGVAVTPWHGDVAASQKNRALKHPSGLLVITPESLEAMLALRSHWAQSAFKNLQYIVIDELHAFIGTERGAQLQSLMSRLDLLTQGGGASCYPLQHPVRIGLSATISSTEQARAFLRPDSSVPCVFPEAGPSDSRIMLALKEYIATDKADPKEAITQELFSRLRGANNLIFTNSRKDAEAYMVALSEKSEQERVPCEFTLHHGSLSRQDRHDVEKALQEGQRPVTAICTASMELGVDIGQVASVAQIGTVTSSQALRQRLGRSGRRGQPAVMRIYSVDEQRDDYKFHLRANLVQNIAAIQLMGEGKYDLPASPEAHASIAVQQLLSLLSQFGSLYAAEAYQQLCGAGGAFSFLSPGDFAQFLKHLGEKQVISQLGNGQLVVALEGERLIGGRDFYSAFTTVPDYLIMDRATGRTIGSVQYKPYYGEIFILGGQKWIVDAVEDRSRSVQASLTHATGKMMFEGSGIEATSMLTAKMKEIYSEDTVYPYLDKNTSTEHELRMAREWFRRHQMGTEPWQAHGENLAFFTWGGMAANRAIALMADVFLGLRPTYDHLAISGLTPAHIETIRKEAVALPVSELSAMLASAVPLAKKTRGKFDPYLPSALLDRQYAAGRLNVPAAVESLQGGVYSSLRWKGMHLSRNCLAFAQGI